MQAIIMRGLPGAGKSTWLKNNHPNILTCSADHFFEKEGQYHFDGSKLGEAHAQCLRQFIVACQAGTPVAVDNTNRTLAECAKYYDIATAYGYDVLVVDMLVEPEVAAARNVHGVPLAAIERMSLERPMRHWKVIQP